MKFLKNIIRLLALTSLSLSLTPLTTIKAAEADAISVDKSDSVVTSLAANDSTEPNSTTSTVTVTVLSGYLTLDAVPDFNFGNIALGSTAKLKNNTPDTTGINNAVDDGNSKGLLQVTDSRNLTSKEDIPGFNLSAKMGSLVGTDNTSLDAILDLSSMPLLDSNNNNVSSSSTSLSTQAASLVSNASSTSTVMDLKKGSYNPGVIKAEFNTPDSASMTLPKNSDYSYDKTSKNMNAVVTWTLTANPTTTTK
ncbi:hypothetical protein FD33_GL001983 [Companilactobacillus paralimentarius DSM 13238 = JCM 10415]|uniref:WxL domain-containing protein n=1 Tax=Companilactobacillus paralimentarius DSM 13238 = JCM 10415 TaxID=1122151 RepID=A0A0R1PGA6_9LACO|nr:WxL domain-containing protein [Companilactobacillus paralimentarius]KAE9563913.1 hypothetical protein ATN96_09595 [Companilactobacillus paralimentarius]KRL31457.1 hypothetical protein FD33_GL001983 [Companilactobacillus paralimentarius DSM 13238 = JCM 10415]MDR4933126.1 WxL domain-containing protein [Companilactobacillus paralimentarius]QFR69648.1 hypothetical protein LP238_07505 [Companilactobacillus paralimentarius]